MKTIQVSAGRGKSERTGLRTIQPSKKHSRSKSRNKKDEQMDTIERMKAHGTDSIAQKLLLDISNKYRSLEL